MWQAGVEVVARRAASCEGSGWGSGGWGLFENSVTPSGPQPISTSWPWNDMSGMR